MPGDSTPSPPPSTFLPHFYSDSSSVYPPFAPSSSSVSRYDSKYYSQPPPPGPSTAYGPYNSAPATFPHPAAPASHPTAHLASTSAAFPSTSYPSPQALVGGSSSPLRDYYYHEMPTFAELAPDPYEHPIHHTATSSSLRHRSYSQSHHDYVGGPSSAVDFGVGGSKVESDTGASSRMSRPPANAIGRSAGAGPVRTAHARPSDRTDPYPSRERRATVKSETISEERKATSTTVTTLPPSALLVQAPAPSPPPSPPPPPTVVPSSQPQAKPKPARKSKAKNDGSGLEKTHFCEICGASFARNHDLTRHYSGHEKIKAFRCNGCDRAFTRKDALKRHSSAKNCGDAQHGEPTGWLKRKATEARGKARRGEEDLGLLLTMPPLPPPSSSRTDARARDAYTTGRATRSATAAHNNRELSPLSEVMALAAAAPPLVPQHHTRSSAGGAYRRTRSPVRQAPYPHTSSTSSRPPPQRYQREDYDHLSYAGPSTSAMALPPISTSVRVAAPAYSSHSVSPTTLLGPPTSTTSYDRPPTGGVDSGAPACPAQEPGPDYEAALAGPSAASGPGRSLPLLSEWNQTSFSDHHRDAHPSSSHGR